MDDWRSYDDVAETYERVHAARFADPARDLVAAAGIGPGDRVLDVGTGTGVAAEAAADAGATVVGFDESFGMLEVGHRVRPKLRLAGGTAIDLPVRSGNFDVVLGNFVLAHFTKYQTALFEATRVLRPGGKVAYTSWSDGPDAYQQAYRELIEGVVPREMLAPAYAQAAPWHEKFRQRGAIEEALIDAGFRQVRTNLHKYRWTYTQAEYIDGLETWATGRFVRQMLGESGWAAFMDRVRSAFAAQFADPLNDFRDVWTAVAVKE
jgi:ubiquinone/menaquinone biosynthesis C-methylase UbiE